MFHLDEWENDMKVMCSQNQWKPKAKTSMPWRV